MPHDLVKIILFFCLSIMTSCASKLYTNTGNQNFEVIQTETSSSYNTNKIELFIYELKKNCQAEHLGIIKVNSKNENLVALDSDKNYFIIANLLAQNFFKAQVTDLGSFLIVPRNGTHYQLHIEIDNDDIGVTYYSLNQKVKKRLSDFSKYPECNYTINYNRIWSSFLRINSNGFTHELKSKLNKKNT